MKILPPWLLSLALLALLATPPLAAQEAGDDPPPCLIPWQRTLDDAEALSRRTGKPLLICVNMDEEAASEIFARRRYSDPKFAELVDCYVPVIVSPNRHTTADYDPSGRRVPCPRFGTVTCGEHIDVEELAYARYFGGRRVAPRHLAVFPAGEQLFDRFLDRDLRRVDDALAAHAECGSPWARLLEDPDAAARAEVESLYLAGATPRRAEILRAAAAAPIGSFDLVLLGLHEDDEGLRALALRALAVTGTADDVERLSRSLVKEVDPRTRGKLFDALEALAARHARAARLVAERRAVREPSTVVAVEDWSAAIAAGVAVEIVPLDQEELFERIEQLSARSAAEPGEPGLELELARTLVTLARVRMDASQDPTILATDAAHHADRAAEAGADRGSARAVRAQAAWILAQRDEARAAALEAAPTLVSRAGSQETYEVLSVLARTHTQAIYGAVLAGKAWPTDWLRDAHAAWSALTLHPQSTVRDVTAHADLLAYLRLVGAESEVLSAGFTLFPDDASLHRRFRALVERTSGVAGLEKAYDALVEGRPDDAPLRWFAGYAGLIVAEQAQRDGEPEDAVAAYERAARLFEVSSVLVADYGASADHFVAVARAGEARIALDAGRLDSAASLLLEALLRRPASVDSVDGLGRTARETLRTLRRAIREAERAELEERLARSLAPVLPEVWRLTAPDLALGDVSR